MAEQPLAPNQEMETQQCASRGVLSLLCTVTVPDSILFILHQPLLDLRLVRQLDIRRLWIVQ
jgi:hypothetical protein